MSCHGDGDEGTPPQAVDLPEGGRTPPCAVCGHSGRHARSVRHLTHGVSVWLCERHRTDAYVTLDRGRRFASRLAAMWAATGALTRRRLRALEAHLERVVEGEPRGRPGSYSWPKLRREAERRFAAGEAPAVVIGELRASYADGPATVPSVRTMRRWFAQARWMAPPGDPAQRFRRKKPLRGRRRPTLAEAIAGIMFYPLFPLVDAWAAGASVRRE